MARSTVQQTSAAADTLLEWLQDRHAARRGRAGAASAAAAEAADAVMPAALPDRPAMPGRIAASAPPIGSTGPTGSAACLWLPHTDWLHHRLVVAGPAAELAAFRAAAAGAGTVPWRLDLDATEEDLVHRLLSPPQRCVLSAASARALARQLCEAAALRHAAAVARVGQSRACPFDLHQLVPVPEAVLQLGPVHPDALLWLWEHWGTTAALRHVAEDRYAAWGRHPVVRADPCVLRLSFWSADWTPWRALAVVAASWTALPFDTRPSYEDP